MDIHFDKKIKSLVADVRPIEWYTFRCAFAIGILTHLFYLTNIAANEDFYIPFWIQSGQGMSYGRWLLGSVSKIFMPYAMPTLAGLLTIVLLSLTAALLTHLLQFNSKIFTTCLAAITVTFPAMAYLSGYVGALFEFTIALFLAVLAALLTDKSKLGWAWGGISLGLSLAIYQAYIAVTMTLLLYLLIFFILDYKEKVGFWKELFKKIGKFLGTGITGGVIYAVGLQVTCSVTGYVLHDNYTGITELGSTGLSTYILRIPGAYKAFKSFFFDNDLYTVSPIIGVVIIAFVMLALINLIFYLFGKRVRGIRSSLVLAFVLLTPLCVNFMEIIAPKIGTTSISCYSYLIVFIISLILLERYPCTTSDIHILGVIQKAKKCIPYVTIMASLMISLQYYNISNAYYLKLTTYYERTYAFANRIVARIEQFPEFGQGMPIALIGQLPNNNYPNSSYNFPEITNDRGLWGQYIGTSRGAKDNYKIFTFIDFYLGVPIYAATNEQIAAIEKTPKFATMNMWPAQNCIQVIDGVIAVKLNDVYNISAKRIEGLKYRLSTLDHTEDGYTYAWYITAPDGTREFTRWYEATADLIYQFKTKGKYGISLFIQNERSERVVIQYESVEII